MTTQPPVNPKTAAWMALAVAAFGVAVLYYPPLLPLCQAINFCETPSESAPVAPSPAE